MKKKTLIPILAILFAVAITAAAAFYSVSGLAKIFAGASTAVIVLAGILESSKLVIATILHRYWTKGLGVGKYLLTFILLGLMLITSAGIYGFLSNAYKVTSAKNEVIEKRIAVIQGKQSMAKERRDRYVKEKNQNTTRLNKLDSNLMTLNGQNTDYQYVNGDGNVVTYASSRKLAALKEQRDYISKQINDTKIQISELDSLISVADVEITDYETEVIEMNMNNEAAAELGPVLYISDLTGWSVDKVVSYFILLFVLIVDPLAITLVVIGNNTLLITRKDEEPELEELEAELVETIVDEEEESELEEELVEVIPDDDEYDLGLEDEEEELDEVIPDDDEDDIGLEDKEEEELVESDLAIEKVEIETPAYPSIKMEEQSETKAIEEPDVIETELVDIKKPTEKQSEIQAKILKKWVDAGLVNETNPKEFKKFAEDDPITTVRFYRNKV